MIQELRLEDYQANRKGKQQGTAGAGGGLFGSTPATSSTGFSFGQQPQQQQQQQQQASTGFAGQNSRPHIISQPEIKTL